MTMIAVNLSADVYQRLRAVAEQRGTTVEAVAESVLATVPPLNERERVTEVLRAAGLLTELSAAEKDRAARATLSLDDARAILSRPGAKSLSDLVLEMREPKE